MKKMMLTAVVVTALSGGVAAAGETAFARLILAGHEGEAVMVRGVSDDGGRAVVERTDRSGTPYRTTIQALTRRPDGWELKDLVGPGFHILADRGDIDASVVGLTRDGRWLVYRYILLGDPGEPKLRVQELDSGREQELEGADVAASRWYRESYGQAPLQATFAAADQRCDALSAAVTEGPQGHALSVSRSEFGTEFLLDVLAGTYPEGKERFGYIGGLSSNALGGYAQAYLFEFGVEHLNE